MQKELPKTPRQTWVVLVGQNTPGGGGGNMGGDARRGEQTSAECKQEKGGAGTGPEQFPYKMRRQRLLVRTKGQRQEVEPALPDKEKSKRTDPSWGGGTGRHARQRGLQSGGEGIRELEEGDEGETSSKKKRPRGGGDWGGESRKKKGSLEKGPHLELA